LNIPSRAQAEDLLHEAQQLNPGRWVDHSVMTGQAAEIIASHLPELDPQAAAILGLLHDIGRRAGVTDIRHCIDGYTYLHELGFENAARICITHIFTIQDINAANGIWDCSENEIQFIRHYLAGLHYDDYDRLIQLCDALALPTGFCLLEKRLVDVAIRRGINLATVDKWKATFQVKADFEARIGKSIYSLLPGVIENTFGGMND
jgi:putative nucleotidyltransferase with HDIG domain